MGDIGKRRSDRVLVTLPVTVSGTNAAGKSFSENAHTVSVSQNGAAIALMTPLVPGQAIVIRRNRSGVPRLAACELAEQIGKQGGLPVYSVAFRKPAARFWDIIFPSLPADADTAGRALLECHVCGARKIVHFHPAALAAYNAERRLSLHCARCRRPTNWVESPQDRTKRPDLGPANAARLAPATHPLDNNERRHRRLAAEIPICIRQAGLEDQAAFTVDISRGGLRFTSSRPYASGSYVQVAIPYSPTALNVFVDAQVAHSTRLLSQDLFHMGIMYLAENEPAP
jgi:hypothetical protein